MILRQKARSQPGFYDAHTLGTFRHEGRSRALNLLDPQGPVVDGPGGPSFVVRDWIEYPGSTKLIEELWTDEDYLYFNETADGWYYRLTRDDLRRLKTSLLDFLRPLYEKLRANDQFNALVNTRPRLMAEAQSVQATLIDRIRDPKPLADLIWP